MKKATLEILCSNVCVQIKNSLTLKMLLQSLCMIDPEHLIREQIIWSP